MRKILILSIFIFSFLSGFSQSPCDSISKSVSFAESPPSFPGENDILSRFLTKNVQYPKELRDSEFKGGTVYLKVIISKDGRVCAIKEARKVKGHPELTEAAIKLANEMPAWNPAIMDGKPVNYSFAVPVRFMPNTSLSDIEGIEENLDSVSEYPGGELKLQLFLLENKVYPRFESIQGVFGVVELCFVVNRLGSIENIQIEKGIPKGSGYSGEARYLITSLPNWKPAMKDGKAVNSRVKLKIAYPRIQI